MCNHNFVEVVEGTTIYGGHLHVYRCTECGGLDYGSEAWEVENG